MQRMGIGEINKIEFSVGGYSQCIGFSWMPLDGMEDIRIQRRWNAQQNPTANIY